MENTHVSIDVKKNIKQFILFSMVGVLNTLISEGVYGFLTYFGMHYVPASLIGFVTAIFVSYRSVPLA